MTNQLENIIESLERQIKTYQQMNTTMRGNLAYCYDPSEYKDIQKTIERNIGIIDGLDYAIKTIMEER